MSLKDFILKRICLLTVFHFLIFMAVQKPLLKSNYINHVELIKDHPERYMLWVIFTGVGCFIGSLVERTLYRQKFDPWYCIQISYLVTSFTILILHLMCYILVFTTKTRDPFWVQYKSNVIVEILGHLFVINALFVYRRIDILLTPP